MYEQSILLHEQLWWKITIALRKVPMSKQDLSLLYSPWVAWPCLEIQKNPERSFDLTRRGNCVAVISNGTAVLWLWDIWALAWLPVMEWKSLLFKHFAGLDSIPLVIDQHDPDTLIDTIVSLAWNFAAINLEDIKSPECFYIEEQLQDRLSIPVFHDDQHGTAIVVLAGIINACKIYHKSDPVVTIIWAWAAGIAVGKLLHAYGIRNIRMVDSTGTINSSRTGLDQYKSYFVATNLQDIWWWLEQAIAWSDILIWLSKAWLITPDHIRSMNPQPIIFALANPTPEIMPDDAYAAWAAVVATWRSDFPNQVNNVLVFPWLIKWLIKKRMQVTTQIKLHAAHVLASLAPAGYIIPDPLTPGIADAIAASIESL